jgi:hypothetical protein
MQGDAAPVLRLYDPATRDWLAPTTADLVVWTGEQMARAELLALLLAGLLLALLGLNLWLLVDRARRRRAERELFARLAVLETDRARAQLAAAGGPAAPRERGVIPRPVEDRRPGLRRVGVESG